MTPTIVKTVESHEAVEQQAVVLSKVEEQRTIESNVAEEQKTVELHQAEDHQEVELNKVEEQETIKLNEKEEQRTIESNVAEEQKTVELHQAEDHQEVELNKVEEQETMKLNEEEEQRTVELNEAKEQSVPAAKAAGPVLPDWLNEEYFVDVLKENIEGFKRIRDFETGLTGGGGENYASIMVRVKVTVDLEDGSTKDTVYMVKTIPQGEQGAMMVNMMGLFPKEIAMYGQLLPEFEKMYRDVGKTVRFGPKFFQFKKNPGYEYVLLEDIGPSGYKNANRLEGLDEQHILTVLKIVAELHAASAVRYETFGEYEDQFMESIFSEKYRPMLEMMGKSFQETLVDCFSARPNTAKYVEKMKTFEENIVSMMIEANNIDLNEFNVVIHGDLWANNIMFRYNSESGKLEDTILVDFQMSRYGSPVIDLLYFLLSSTKLELKVACFDKFVKFYHEQLAANLRLLNYPKKIPTLRDLHIQILKRGVLAFTFVTGIMATVLMNPREDANIENFIGEGEGAQNFQKQMFNNPRFLKHADVVLEWLDLRGLLEF